MDGPPLQLAVQYADGTAGPARDQIRRWVAAALALAVREGGMRIASATLAFRFVDHDEGRRLNRDFRDKDYATNVLTFVLDEPVARSQPRDVAADIVLCMPVIEAEALAQHKSLKDHCAHLCVHGTLHACGYDHDDPDDAVRMETVETRTLARFRIADPYAEAP